MTGLRRAVVVHQAIGGILRPVGLHQLDKLAWPHVTDGQQVGLLRKQESIDLASPSGVVRIAPPSAWLWTSQMRLAISGLPQCW